MRKENARLIIFLGNAASTSRAFFRACLVGTVLLSYKNL